MAEIIRSIQAFHENAFNFIVLFQDRIFGGKRIDGLHLWQRAHPLYERVVGFYGNFLGNGCFDRLSFRDPDVSPEAEHFLAHGFLEPVYKGKSDNHYRHADNRSRYGEANNEAGKGFLLVEGDAPRNKRR